MGTPLISSNSDSLLPSEAERTSVFLAWCLRREAFSFRPQSMMRVMFMYFGISFATSWTRWNLTQGSDLLGMIFGLAATLTVFVGAVHASQAVYWESSSEMRDLVRLTGIGPIRLLFCATFARWWTIFCLNLSLVPFFCFARTLGGISTADLLACGAVLLMLAVLTASLSLIAAVSTAGSENAAATAATAAILLLILYHCLFWFSAALVSSLYWGIHSHHLTLQHLWWWVPYRFALDAAPLHIVILVASDPSAFSVLTSSFWVHFLTAAYFARLAVIVMTNRFRANSGAESPTNVSIKRTSRPRCTDAPFFWKDLYVIGGGVPAQRRWTFTYCVLAAGLLLVGLAWNAESAPVTLAVLVVCVLPIIFTFQFDSTMAAEFELQTFQSLMLLPIDRRTIFWAKFTATAWQHRAICLPMGMAIAINMPTSSLEVPVGIFITGLMASLVGLLICQFAVRRRLSRPDSWNGTIHAAAILVLLFTCCTQWVSFGLWIGFSVVLIEVFGFLLVTQYFVDRDVQFWSE